MILDITLDLETLSLAPNAAPMQIAAIAWLRNALESPFTDDSFLTSIDLRSCVAIGCDFDPKTIKFWADAKPEAKLSVLYDQRPVAINDALDSLFRWIRDMLKKYGADEIRVWTQGSDFDIPILRYTAIHARPIYSFDEVIPRTAIRDARSFILEVGKQAYDPYLPFVKTTTVKPKSIYDHIPPMPDDTHNVHDALYDARRTTWCVWNIMKEHHLKYPIPE